MDTIKVSQRSGKRSGRPSWFQITVNVKVGLTDLKMSAMEKHLTADGAFLSGLAHASLMRITSNTPPVVQG